MDMLKKFFPYAFKAKKDVVALIINILVHIAAGFVIGLVLGLVASLLAGIPVVGTSLLIFGTLLNIIGRIIDLYLFISMVLSILHFCKVLK